MTDNIIALDFNGVKVILDDNTRLVRLQSTGAGDVTMHDTADDSNYQVPTGKKFTIIFIESGSFGAGDKIISSTVADSTTGEVVLLEPGANNLSLTIFISTEVAADLFITKVDAASTTYTINGIEEDV